ncbi:MAG: alpha/beta hydrolase [Desulfuromonadales bacterium]|nr:alpha/beta hydrolase [Desulfuromonadales bacterium]
MKHSEILDHPIISERYFFPRTTSIPQPFWVECEGARLACAYHEIDAEAHTIVHFHGNGEVVADYLDGFPELIGRMGCNCFLAELRGYGGSTGSPQLGKMLKDVQHTIEAIGQPHNKLILFGRSVGSLFAIKAAELFPDVAGLILESAIADPLQRLLLRMHPEELGVTSSELTEAVTRAIDIEHIMTRFTRPTLIMHTRHDGLIDVSHAEQLARWCGGPVQIEIFPQGNHNDIMFVNGSQYFSLINEFLDALRD